VTRLAELGSYNQGGIGYLHPCPRLKRQLEMVNHHDFNRGRKIWHDLMMITQPLIKRMSMGNVKLTIVMQSSKGEKHHQKVHLCD
jgi:hypothetical protein